MNKINFSNQSIFKKLLIFYLILTTTIYFISIYQGTEGVSVKIFGGGDDGVFYWEQAKNVMNGKEWIKTSIYPYILGQLLKVANVESTYLLRLFNLFGFFLMTLASKELVKLQMEYSNNYDEKKINTYYNKLLTFFFFYLSLLMVVNMSILRDIWIYLFYLISVNLSLRILYKKENRFKIYLLLLFSLFMLWELRKYALLSFTLGSIIHLFNYKIKLKIKKSTFVLFLILIFMIWFKYMIDMPIPIVNMTLRKALDYRLSFLEIYHGGSQMWISLNHDSFILFLLNYIHSYFGNLIGPLPWHIKSMSVFIVFIFETIPMCLILLDLWKKKGEFNKIQSAMMTHAFVWIALIAITNDNIGAATRLRPVSWLLFLCVFVTFSRNT